MCGTLPIITLLQVVAYSRLGMPPPSNCVHRVPWRRASDAVLLFLTWEAMTLSLDSACLGNTRRRIFYR